MKSVKLSEKGKFEVFIEDLPIHDKENDVLVKIASVGICGSDMHYYKYGRIGENIVNYPYTIGHEASGYVEEIYNSSVKLKKGDLVAIDPAIACGKCDQCMSKRENTCRNLLFMGAPGQLEGLMKEYVTLPHRNIFKVPKNYSPNEAAFIEPLSIGVHSVALANIKYNDRISILGVGPIGISTLLSLRYYNLSNILVTDKLDYRLEKALKLGAEFKLSYDECFTNKHNHSNYDVVFECAGDQKALDFAVQILKPGGKLIIVGIPAVDKIYFDINEIRRKELQIINVRRQNKKMEEAIKIFDKYKKYSDQIITHSFSMAESGKAYNLVYNYGDQILKSVINFNM